MLSKFTTLSALGLLSVMFTTCGSGTSTDPGTVPMPTGGTPSNAFNSYWYQGKAEVSRYELTQARYGELRNGEAVMIFVSEDFLTKEQVKFEGGIDGPRTGILKLNWIERFNTGIYDYSLMTSIFSPVDGTPTLKTTCSVQDWCGQAFMQLNHRNNGYAYEVRSYFEKEADMEGHVDGIWLEDAVWNQLRIDPKGAPVGDVEMLPSSRYLRLMHKPVERVRVNASMVEKNDTSTYRMHFTTYDRVVNIRFGTQPPHTIFGWDETRMDGYGANAKRLTTAAKLTHQVMEPYWGMNANADDAKRDELGLPRMPQR